MPIFFILDFIKHVYQQIWRVSTLLFPPNYQTNLISFLKINHQWWQWYRRLGQCWPQYLTASKGKQGETTEKSKVPKYLILFSAAKITVASCRSGRRASTPIRLLFMVQSEILGEVSSGHLWSEPTIDRLFCHLWAVLEAI